MHFEFNSTRHKYEIDREDNEIHQTLNRNPLRKSVNKPLHDDYSTPVIENLQKLQSGTIEHGEMLMTKEIDYITPHEVKAREFPTNT